MLPEGLGLVEGKLPETIYMSSDIQPPLPPPSLSEASNIVERETEPNDFEYNTKNKIKV